MQAREYLKQVEKLDKLIENKLKELEQWQSIATGISAAPMGERVQSSGSQQKMADAVYRLIELQEDLNNLIDQYIDTKQGVIMTIEQLSADEYDVIHKMYIQGKPIKETASACGKSYEWVKTMHKRGLRNVQMFLGKKASKIPNNTQ